MVATPASGALRGVPIHFTYVLILEWLDPDEDRTGRALHEFLAAQGIASRLKVCASAADVQRELEAATAGVADGEVPAVHIEAHGSDPKDGGIRTAEFGPLSGQGLTWSELGDYLAPLNEATGLRLLVVGAACWGLSAVATMKPHRIAPFAACVGFATSVEVRSLKAAMRELYGSITTGTPLVQAVDQAQRELFNAGEGLQVTSAVRLAVMALNNTFAGIKGKAVSIARAGQVLQKARPENRAARRRAVAIIPKVLPASTKRKVRDTWRDWFPSIVHNSNSAYRLDWNLIRL